MKAEHRRIIVDVDVEKGEIALSLDMTIAERPVSQSNARLFRLVEVSIADLKVHSVQAIESRLGGLLLEVLGHIVPQLNEYKTPQSVVSDALAHAHQEIETRAKAGDPEAQNVFGMMLLERGVAQLSVSLLDEAEDWFRKAANAGHMAAGRFLNEGWPRIKREEGERIRRLRNDQP